MASRPRIVAAVVTRDRRDVLRQTLTAILGQTRPPDALVVVDNASSDGTPEMLAEDFSSARVVALPENQGATGGFAEAIAAGSREGADWVWLLDDDSVATPTALEDLLAALDRLDGAGAPALLCSRVVWRDGEPHLMNRPVVQRRDHQAFVDAVGMGLLPLRAATWVSLLLSRDAIERAGSPPRHFFYQADDIEYTARILRDAPGYFVSESVVEHRTASQHTAINDDHRFYFHIRNTILMLRGSAWRASEKPVLVWWLVSTSLVYLRINHLRPRSLANLLRALSAGLRFRLH